MARPQHLANYENPDAADLAAAYAYGLARNHGFVDGNKRTAWIAARVFLADQGLTLIFEKTEAVSIMERVAAGTVIEAELAAWFRQRLT
jgi:death-on-curing protein